MSSIISKENLAKIDNIRKWVLKIGIWTLIGGVIMGALLILIADKESGEIFGKFMGTLFIVALMMMICVNNFHRLVSDDRAVSTFALVGLLSNVLWAALWILICWNPDLLREQVVNSYSSIGYYSTSRFSMLAKFAYVASFLSSLGFFGSNILSIYEGQKSSIIRPLKITATACVTYEMIYFIVTAFSDFDFSSEVVGRLGALAIFAGFAWIIITIVALVISKREKNRELYAKKLEREKKVEKYEEAMIASSNKENDSSSKTSKTDDELRAEIEEKVRREMIEKEVREKVEKEMAEKQPGSENN